MIKRNLRKFRLEENLTQAQLASLLGVQAQTVSKWETGVSMPDITLLPLLADSLNISIDTLLGANSVRCCGTIDEDDTEFLLKTYSQMYAPEAGPWNLSTENKYLEYRFRAFLENHVKIESNFHICNIGIGAGEWDTFLSYQVRQGSLVSVDRLPICCRQLEKRLAFEQNPTKVTVLCADAMTLDFCNEFDLVTIVGSTGIESKQSLALLGKAAEFVKNGGHLYYQSLDKNETCDCVIRTAQNAGFLLKAFEADHAYNFSAQYFIFEKATDTASKSEL